MLPLELVRLTGLMERTSGSPDVKIGLIDGPVAFDHAELAAENLREVPRDRGGATCTQADSAACMHGTFIAGILAARRSSSAPAICPGCTLLVHPIFAETVSARERMPGATPTQLAEALIACIDARARLINLSVGLVRTSSTGEHTLNRAFDYAMTRGVIVVAAAGNQGTLGSSAITRHPWIIPVAACDARGRPMSESNLGLSIGRRGLRAPGEVITSLGSDGQTLRLGGTSVATPFVTGAMALLWSEFPAASAAHIKLAVMHHATRQRRSVTPPLLDATDALDALRTTTAWRRSA